MVCSKCNKIGKFPKLQCDCEICRDCFYDFCCPKCRRDFCDLGDGTFVAEASKVEEGIIFEKQGIFFSSLSNRNVRILGKKYDTYNTLIEKKILNELNFRYLCAREFRTGFISTMIIDLNDFRVFKLNEGFFINYIKELETYELDMSPPVLRRQVAYN